jgi:cold shock CspA family protein
VSEKRKGVVDSFGSKGFGFLTDSETSKRLFFHVSDVEDGKELRAGDRVEYQEALYPKGPRAIQVNPVKSPDRAPVSPEVQP